MSQIQKKQLHILSKSKNLDTKESGQEIFSSFLQFASHKKQPDLHFELNRLCQSLSKVHFVPQKILKRKSKSTKASPERVKFETPVHSKPHRKFQKTPYPKSQL